ncbi:MAG: hypothetical protein ACOC6F_02325 [bacterium]
MITERELRQIAGRRGLGVGQTEHEYAMLCVLDALSQTSLLAGTFCLKGGTALQVFRSKWPILVRVQATEGWSREPMRWPGS